MNKVQIEDLYQFQSISNFMLSPNEEKMLYTRHLTKKDGYQNVLELFDLKDESCEDLESISNVFYWKSDCELVCTMKNETNKVSVYHTDTKNAEFYFETKNHYTTLIPVGADQFLGLHTAQVKPELSPSASNQGYTLYDELPFRENGMGAVNGKRTGLYFVDICKNTEEQITPAYFNAEALRYSRMHNKAVLIGASYEEVRPVSNDVWVYDLDQKKLFDPIKQKGLLYSFACIREDGMLLTACSDMKIFGENQDHTFFLTDLAEGILRPLADPKTSMWNSIATDCKLGGTTLFQYVNGALYFITTKPGGIGLNKLTNDGEIIKIPTNTYTVDSFAVANGKIYFAGLRNQELHEMYEILGNGTVNKLTTLNDWLQDKVVSQPEDASYTNLNGDSIDGWIWKPVDFEEGKKYPVVLCVHGGPKMNYAPVFNHEIQTFTANGYAVVCCNPRGSNGKDDRFADLRGKFGTIDYDDIMGFLDMALEKYPFLDEKKMAIVGGSYGGYMVNWTITQTQRFCCAVSQRSISNWTTMYGLSDIGYHWTEYQTTATPYKNFEHLWKCSPISMADRVKTPTLFLHSDEDFRCPLSEAIQMYTSLKNHGTKARLCVFHGENHNLSRSGKPANRVSRLQMMLDWLKENGM